MKPRRGFNFFLQFCVFRDNFWTIKINAEDVSFPFKFQKKILQITANLKKKYI